MATIKTAFGYEVVVDGATLPPLLSASDLSDLTSGRFGASTAGVDSVLQGVSSAIRSICGWHVAPLLNVIETTEGPERVITLKSLNVDSINHVYELDEELTQGQYEWRQDGLLKRCQWKSWPSSWQSVVVDYMSGLPDDAAYALKVVAAQVASNALAAPAGVSSEQAGDVSIKYNATESGVSGGVRLLPSDIALLEPYCLPGKWS